MTPNGGSAMPLSALIGLIIAAAWCWIGGLAFRAGHLRRMGQWYFEPALPAFVRHLPLLLVPTAAFLSCIVVLAIIAPDNEEELSPVGVVFFLLIFVSAIWWVIVTLWPPQFLKPIWIRERETSAR
jgi:hypothetical protein